jgi:hypothetical protein
LNAVKDKFDYLYRLKFEIQRLHECPACYLRTQSVDETIRGAGQAGDETTWIGDVEVFTLTGHPKAKICYAWSYRKGKNQDERVVTVLEIPPVNSPQTAVRASIVSDLEKGR